ncbi:unnamed protein product, partial [Prunus brigantina]
SLPFSSQTYTNQQSPPTPATQARPILNQPNRPNNQIFCQSFFSLSPSLISQSSNKF